MPSNQDTKPPINLVLCFDGTGNSFLGSDADTNVVKLLSKLKRSHPEQYHYYQSGIGTYEVNETSVNKSRIGHIRSSFSMQLDQGAGTTFDAHVIAGYKFLMRYYEDGAKIYMFGFSRGAYTATFLAQMINTVGLLCKGNEELVSFAYRLFQDFVQGRVKGREESLKNKTNTGGRGPNMKFRVTCPNDSIANDEYSDSEVDEQAHDSGKEFGDDSSEEDNTPLCNNKKGKSVYNYGSNQAANGSIRTSEQSIHQNCTSIPSQDKVGSTKKKADHALQQVHAFSRAFCRENFTAKNSGTDETNNIKVHFLGLWDCVASVAVLERRAHVPAPIIGTAKYVRHAVAIDEQRVKFRPWILSPDCEEGETQNDGVQEDDIKEVWFPGSHSDVGGGWAANNPVETNNVKQLKLWERIRYFLFGSEPTEPRGGALKPGDDIQMSDVSLAWMIEELKGVEQREELESNSPKLHWNKSSLRKFYASFNAWKRAACPDLSKAQSPKIDFIHRPLQFNYGTSFGKVLLWKFLEYVPFVPRWDFTNGNWKYERFWPNAKRPRSIPKNALLHESLYWRLKNDTTYQPQNTYGDLEDELHGIDQDRRKHNEWSTKNHELWTIE